LGAQLWFRYASCSRRQPPVVAEEKPPEEGLHEVSRYTGVFLFGYLKQTLNAAPVNLLNNGHTPDA